MNWKNIFYLFLRGGVRLDTGNCVYSLPIENQGIAYILKSEVKMYDKETNDNSDLIQVIVNHIITYSDENNDGEIGWGLSYEWDAFGDGSVNPSNHVYAIEVVNIMDALMDSLDAGVLDVETENKTKRILHDVAVIWNTKYWTEENEDGKYFYWYSISENDEIECTNISAKMAGSLSRLMEFPDVFDENEKRFISERVEKTMSRVLELAYYNDDGILVWDYMPCRTSSENDLIHHAFILEGIFDYYRYHKVAENSYDNTELLEYIYECIDYEHKLLFSYPDHSYNRAFDLGATPFINDNEIYGQILSNSYKEYFETKKTDDVQLTFILYAYAVFISENNIEASF